MKFILSVLVLVILVSMSISQDSSRLRTDSSRLRTDYSALGGLPSKKYDALNGEQKEVKSVTTAPYCPPAG